MKNAVVTFIASLRASRCLGGAFRLRHRGKLRQALEKGRKTLVILNAAPVNRQSPTAGAVHAGATVFVEELAKELNEPGAQTEDLDAAIEFYRCISGTAKSSDEDFASWLVFLESRRAARLSGALPTAHDALDKKPGPK